MKNVMKIYATDNGYTAVFTGKNEDGECVNGQESHDIEGDSPNDIAQNAAMVWGVDMDTLDVQFFDDTSINIR